MAERTYRVGLLGWGNAGKFFHAPFIEAVAGLELVAVTTSRRTEVLSRFPAITVYDTVEALLADPAVDLVVVATPHRLHVSHAREAIAAGKHAVVEKPLAETAAEAVNLAAQARQAGRLLAVFQNRRWDGDFRTAKQIIASNLLGDVYYFESHWPLYRPALRGVWREDPAALGGVLYDLGPHMVDQVICLFGKPASVYAQLAARRPNARSDDQFRLHLHYKSGLDAVLMVDFMAPVPGPRFHMRGTHGTFEKFGLDPQEAALRAGKLPAEDDWGIDDPAQWGRLRTTTFGGLTFDGKITTLAGDYRQFYQAVCASMAQSVDFPVSLDDVVLQLRILEAARQSAASNTVQTLA